MKTRTKLIGLSVVTLLTVGVLTFSVAWGSGEPEAPFWKVSFTRFESGSKAISVSIRNATGAEPILHGTILSKSVEIKCKAGGFESGGAIEGSLAKHSGKVVGVLELKECKLFVKEGETETYTEQAGCEVPTIKSVKLAGKLWLEGTKAAMGTKPDIVFEPKELTGGKKLIANIEVKVKTTCAYTGTYALEGTFATKLRPENEEFTSLVWVFPATAIPTVWLPESEAGELTVGMELASKAATLQGELQVELTSKEVFGGGIDPVYGVEAPFWIINTKRLEGSFEKSLVSNSPTATIHATIKTVEVEIKCVQVLSGAKIIGSATGSDGKIEYSIKFTECKLFVKEGAVFKEQPKCEVPSFNTNTLSGRLWLEGTKALRGKKVLVVVESANGVIAELSIKNKGGETCPDTETNYKIEGNLPNRVNPENSESEKVTFVYSSSPPTEAWQPAQQEGEEELGLKHGSEKVILEDELVVELGDKEPFGGGPEAC
jgi:hypothetical protein